MWTVVVNGICEILMILVTRSTVQSNINMLMRSVDYCKNVKLVGG
jgi:hypothetical protein